MGSVAAIFILLLSIAHLTPPSHLFVSGDIKLIHNTCKKTTYYNLCMSSLKSSSSSLKADIKGLAVIMIGIAMKHANQTTTYLSSQLLSNTNDVVIKKVVKDCADKYSLAIESLQESLQQLDLMSSDYASLQVSAAKDYPNVCHNEYRRFAGLAYPIELAHREEKLEHMCDVALGIIDVLGW
ncbi:Cell wall / vacuolar inhibitor of fructosidase [Thalictrum thalictroides]|uniref:Cell wall / vacuolar inhibitor of fructosidase n=1 Tax=Thalictrum thalictroides TaxID=46969 RepID=A0A7J6X5W0_THATH|nr:Cell wall / vacuolar inhibitor of fructosidase [Thalictrum thalictroides]